MELRDIKGTGEKKLMLLNKLDINTVSELVNFFPKSYTDLTKVEELDFNTPSGLKLIKATVVSIPESLFSTKTRKPYIKVQAISNGIDFSIIWFNNPYVKLKIIANKTYLFFGKIEKEFSKVTIFNPIFEDENDVKQLKGMIPNYTLTEGLTQNDMRKMINDALEYFHPKSVIPSDIESLQKLGDIKACYRLIHNPKNHFDIAFSRNRIVIEEILQLSFSLKRVGFCQAKKRINPLKKGQDNLNNFIEKLPFVLTKSQEKALNKILKTMSLEKNLNILLQGDVGSGKTIIAFLAMYFATLNGHQCVFMAPTEVLAKQHYENAKKLFFEKNIKIAFLSGSLNEKQKRETIETIESGEANFIIGTHSVILNDIKYKNIGLVITDEQHRFSVNQRKTISSLSENLDIIIMSATPIPRTLALVVYGDMDIITLHEKPLNRLAIKTSLVPKHKISDMYEFIKKQFNQGGQAYFICPRIEDSESSNLVSVEKQFLELKKIFKDYKIAMLHGDIKSDEKNKIMSAFKQKEYDALVSTTVIEVGVDVKDACIIVVYDSDRFGLTQLHQLRGRVGRGDKQSYCFILSESENELSKKRLKIFTSTDDGFELSNQDFNLRGCGELLGNSQHGYINPVFKRLTIDGKVLQKCKELKEILLNTQNYFDFFNQTVKEEYKKDLNAVL